MLVNDMDESLDGTIREARAGDAAAWRRLIDAYSGRVFGLMLRQCRDRELAEELTQATFVQIVEKLGDYDEQGNFEAWLFRIAMNRLRDEMRRRKRHAVPTDFDSAPPDESGRLAGPSRDSVAPHAALAQRERVDELMAAVNRLNEADQQMIYMRYTADMSFQQIADVLEQPLGTVLARGHRALKKLRDLMQETEDAA